MEKIEIKKEGDTYIAIDECTKVVDEGKTVEEALDNLREAMQLYHWYDDADKASPIYNLDQAIAQMDMEEIEKLALYAYWILDQRSDS